MGEKVNGEKSNGARKRNRFFSEKSQFEKGRKKEVEKE